MHRSPRWDIHKAVWKSHGPNRRFGIYAYGAASGVDDVVLDRETGLVWERSPETGKKTWDATIVYACSKVKARRKGWRLPTIEELLSLVDPAQNNPVLPAGHPFLNVQFDDFYWSCTLGMSAAPTYAWGNKFGNGDTSNCLKTTGFYVWLVRGESGHDYPY